MSEVNLGRSRKTCRVHAEHRPLLRSTLPYHRTIDTIKILQIASRLMPVRYLLLSNKTHLSQKTFSRNKFFSAGLLLDGGTLPHVSPDRRIVWAVLEVPGTVAERGLIALLNHFPI